MPERILVKKNSYHDSVTLMSVSKGVSEVPGVLEAMVGMGTEHNKELLANVGFRGPEVEGAGPDDLIIAVRAQTDEVAVVALERAEELLKRKEAAGAETAEPAPRTIRAGVEKLPGANLAVISVPGRYAAREARQALKNGLHVLLFSDNVPVEDEIELKTFARERGLLMMGPDCGTAIINHVALGFANAVRPGDIGVVGASGTGTQEVTSLIDRLGAGVSQVIGTGGRDLSAQVGGFMMIEGIKALGADPGTKVIVLISKPPAPEVAGKALAALKETGKAGVVCFIGGDPKAVEDRGFAAGLNLLDTAVKAVALSRGEPVRPFEWPADNEARELARGEAEKLAPGQKYLRGLFSGGTLCDEAMKILSGMIGDVYSNIPLRPELKIEGDRGYQNSCVDLGDNRFTVGRPHPMIDHTLRIEKIRQEAVDPELAALYLDCVIGYGSHPDPAGELAPAIREARALAAAQGRHLIVVSSVCGTEGDPQNLSAQIAKLKEAGTIVRASNAEAARLAGLVLNPANAGCRP